MLTQRLTTAQAIVKYLIAQRTVIDGTEVPLFPGVFAIFGHGNVTCLGQALEEAGDLLPTWRGQNEQGMAIAAAAFAKARRRRQIMVATSSIGPGATNMVTAAGVAHANRLPLLLLSGDTFVSRAPDPVLQQVEHFDDPTMTVNDAFRAVVRYWDRITSPEQVAQTLPAAVSAMLDPADCGPAFIGLPQDVQARAWDYPEVLFEPVVHTVPRPRPDRGQVEAAVAALRESRRPLIIAGGGVHYSGATAALTEMAERHGIPVVETMAGKATLLPDHPLYGGPVGVTGCEAANELAAETDLVLAVGTRLQDFTTGSWTIFANEDMTMVGLNAARFDASKHRSLPVVGDALVGIEEIGSGLGDWRADPEWTARALTAQSAYRAYISELVAAGGSGSLPTYAQVVAAVDRDARPEDYVVSAAGGLPGELNNGWFAKGIGTFDCEYGFSCMGYEISGGWGARMARTGGEVITFCGDGSYMMANSDLYSSVITGNKMIVVVCDNGGFAVINRLQVNQGGRPFNNLLVDARTTNLVPVDFAAHAAAMGCGSEKVSTIDELEQAMQRARASDRTYVVVIDVDPHEWTEGGAFWEVGVPEVSDRPEVREARRALLEGKAHQRVGW